MKKLVLFLLMALLGVNSALATDHENEQDVQKPTITFFQAGGDFDQLFVFTYDNLEDLQTFDYEILSSLFDINTEDCQVTATVTLTHTYAAEGNIGVASTGQQTTISVSASVTTSCSEIGGAVKRILADLRKQLGI